MPVLEVGTGVGYLRNALDDAWRFAGRGSPGEEERGSNAGRSEGAGRLIPAILGSEGSKALLIFEGEESISVGVTTTGPEQLSRGRSGYRK